MWSNKTKNSAPTPSLKNKVATKIERARILTPDGNQILVGPSCNFILVWRKELSFWVSTTTKAIGEIWTKKVKIPIT